jgi:hypothetical protein
MPLLENNNSCYTITPETSLFENDQENKSTATNKGLPGYTYKYCAGELWRSQFDKENNIIIINSGHADFIYASKILA